MWWLSLSNRNHSLTTDGGAGGPDGGGEAGGGSAAAASGTSAPSSPRAASNVWSPEERARLKRGVVSVRASTDIPLGNAVRADESLPD